MCNNPHSTTSPKLSPTNISLTNSSQLTPPPTDENDNNLNNVDEGFENDNISVTGSPRLANSTEDDERQSPSPLPQSLSSSGGAFTSLIHRNSPNLKKSDFLAGFSSHLQHQQHHHLHHQPPQQHAFNHALAAQLFLQSPLMPQPTQWLYSQLYGNSNYNDLPWFRSSIQSNNNNNNNGFRLIGANCNGSDTDESIRNHLNLAKRTVTLISHQNEEPETCTSPPVTSTKRTPSPDDVIEIVANSTHKSKNENSLGPVKCRTPKQNDVWRPY